MGAFRQRLVIYFQNQLLRVSGVLVGEAASEPSMSRAELLEWLQLLIAAGKQEREAVLGQLPLQLAVVEFLKNKEQFPQDSKKSEESKEKENKKSPKIEKKTAVKQEEVEKKTEAKNEVPITVEEVEKQWSLVLAAVKSQNYAVEAFLRSANRRNWLIEP